MKTHSTITTLLAILLSAQCYAQGVSKDSLNALNEQKQNIEVSKKLNERRIELAKLQNDFAEKSKNVEKETAEAQTAANENQELASKLKSDPQNKDLGDQANKAARKAEKSAKSARNANEDLQKIQKDMDDLKKKIAEDESKLGVQSSQSVQSSAITSFPLTSQNMSGENSGQVIRRNIVVDSATSNGSAQAIADKVIESTYRNYPQQSGQPTIIINNIIVPSDYERPKPAAQRNEMLQNDMNNSSDYEEFKAWQRQRMGQQGYNGRQNQNYSQPAQGNEMASQQNMPQSGDHLTFRERFGERTPRNSGLWVIPVVGIHASDFKADLNDGEADGRIGWNAGLDLRFHAKRFFIQPGAHYFSSSMRVTSEDSISNAPLLTGPRLHSLKVPVLLGLYLTKANKGFFKMNVKAGATGTYVIAVDKSDLAQFDKDNIEEFSYGLNAGIGLEFGFITLDITHEWGMSALFKQNNVKNNVLRATIGFKL